MLIGQCPLPNGYWPLGCFLTVFEGKLYVLEIGNNFFIWSTYLSLYSVNIRPLIRLNSMEGILWKWTNYWNGWQTRWFILENGVLSYYKSQDEVNQGCKGSVKVSVCQINVNNIDNTRLDLVIPGQQHMYLRAPSPQDRQKWLVALGSAKACVDSKVEVTGFDDPNSLMNKKSELRLYCDLMMQQVHAVRSAATAEGPDIQKIDEASSLLTSTCDTFIRTLEDIMKLTSNTGANSPLYELPLSNMTVPKNNGHSKTSSQPNNRSHKQNLSRSSSQENR